MTTQSWQPIDTAPKNGRVLVWTDTDNSRDRWYIESVFEGEHVRCVQVGILGADGEWDCALVGQPTHWMPLPEAPLDPSTESVGVGE